MGGRARSPPRGEIWDVGSARNLGDVRGRGLYNDGKVFAACFSRRDPDAAAAPGGGAAPVLVASGGHDHCRIFTLGARYWEDDAEAAPPTAHVGNVFGTQLGPVMALDFSPAGAQHLVAMGCKGGVVRTYEVAQFDRGAESPRASLFHTAGGSLVFQEEEDDDDDAAAAEDAAPAAAL